MRSGNMPQSLYQNWQFAIEVNGFDVALFRKGQDPKTEFEEVAFARTYRAPICARQVIAPFRPGWRALPTRGRPVGRPRPHVCGSAWRPLARSSQSHIPVRSREATTHRVYLNEVDTPPNYIGVAKRGRVQERIQEHLDAGNIPGAKVQIEQKSSVQKAREAEARAIARSKPKYNEQG